MQRQRLTNAHGTIHKYIPMHTQICDVDFYVFVCGSLINVRGFLRLPRHVSIRKCLNAELRKPIGVEMLRRW